MAPSNAGINPAVCRNPCHLDPVHRFDTPDLKWLFCGFPACIPPALLVGLPGVEGILKVPSQEQEHAALALLFDLQIRENWGHFSSAVSRTAVNSYCVPLPPRLQSQREICFVFKVCCWKELNALQRGLLIFFFSYCSRVDRKLREGARALVWGTEAGGGSLLTWCYLQVQHFSTTQWAGRFHNSVHKITNVLEETPLLILNKSKIVYSAESEMRY